MIICLYTPWSHMRLQNAPDLSKRRRLYPGLQTRTSSVSIPSCYFLFPWAWTARLITWLPPSEWWILNRLLLADVLFLLSYLKCIYLFCLSCVNLSLSQCKINGQEVEFFLTSCPEDRFHLLFSQDEWLCMFKQFKKKKIYSTSLSWC